MVRIITDSTCDMSAEQAQALGVTIVPLTVHFGQEAYQDGVEISPAQFYEKLAASGDTLPTTSQVNPTTFVELFENVLEAGDDVVGIFLSSELSGTYQSSTIARGMLDEGDERIHLIDSRAVTFPMALIVHEAALMRDQGLSAAEIAHNVADLTRRIRLLAVVDTLKYLKLGGRISAATALVGGALGITPIIGFDDGKVVSLGKSRGRKGGIKWMVEQLEKAPIDTTRGVAFGHSNAPDAMDACMEAFAAATEGAPYTLTSFIGSVVGTHAGPGATGIAYFVKE